MANEEKYVQKEQRRIHELVSRHFPQFYLTGGTALAFHFNHRFSEDLDYFSQAYTAKDAEKVMKLISSETGYPYRLLLEQKGPKLLPIRMYHLDLKKDLKLKIDIVRDPYKNVASIEGGMHAVEDIYYRKLQIPLNPLHVKQDDIGREISLSRQKAKDVYDIFYLSRNYRSLDQFYRQYFSMKDLYKLETWYRSLERQDIKFRLLDLASGIDTGDVFRELDRQILINLNQDS